MREKIARYRAGLPINAPLSSEDDYYSSFDVEFRNFWTNGSYYAIFAGMGFLPDTPYPALAYRSEAMGRAIATFERIKKAQSDLVNELPTNFEFLSRLHANEQSAARSPALAMSHATSTNGGGE